MRSPDSGGAKPFPNIPAPAGSKAGTPYSRFIPREELDGKVSAWQPGNFNGVERRAQPRPEGAPEPTVEEWRAKIGEARQQGYQDGYRDGLVALEAFKQSFASQGTAQVGALISSFDAQLTAMEEQMAVSLARSAVLLARQVLRQELQQHPEHIAGLAQQAINAVLMSARHIAVHVHPEDLDLVADGAADALRSRGARLLADPALARGGCRIESDAGTIDATLQARWQRAAASLGSELPLVDG